jgi:hypothetical protein
MTITIDEFITKWTGKTVDTDGIYPNQCMDLMHQYCIDVLGLADARILAQAAAYLVFTNFNTEFGHDYFDIIKNTPDNVPRKGDILIFGQDVGPYGHVCVFIEGDVNSFKSFDANWPLGSLPHIQDHNYMGVLGWLRFKVVSLATGFEVSADLLKDYARFKAYYEKITDYNTYYQEADRVISDLQSIKTLQEGQNELKKELANTKTDCQSKLIETSQKIIQFGMALKT